MRKAEGLFLQRLGVPAPLPESVRPRGALWLHGAVPAPISTLFIECVFSVH